MKIESLPPKIEAYFQACDICHGRINTACETCRGLRAEILKWVNDLLESGQ